MIELPFDVPSAEEEGWEKEKAVEVGAGVDAGVGCGVDGGSTAIESVGEGRSALEDGAPKREVKGFELELDEARGRVEFEPQGSGAAGGGGMVAVSRDGAAASFEAAVAGAGEPKEKPFDGVELAEGEAPNEKGLAAGVAGFAPKLTAAKGFLAGAGDAAADVAALDELAAPPPPNEKLDVDAGDPPKTDLGGAALPKEKAPPKAAFGAGEAAGDWSRTG